jgi:hypothetical protein
MASQGLLFSEPSIAETGVWCTLNDGIDPAEWAYLCRKLGQMSSGRFQEARSKLSSDPDSLRTRLRRIFCFDRAESAHLPLISIGPSGLSGAFQKEIFT